jgi:hypothetical protein
MYIFDRGIFMLDKQYWHYLYWEFFSELIYSKTLSSANTFDDGRIHHQSVLHKIDEDGNYVEYSPFNSKDLYFIKFVKGNEFYIVPKRFEADFPIQPKTWLNVKLKKTDSQVWKYLKTYDSLSIPQTKTKEFKQFVNEWNPMTHSNPKVWTLLKLISFTQGLKMAICGECACGKNANLTIRRHIDRKTLPKIKSPSKAKFYTELFYNDYINIDEITSWKLPEVNIIEDTLAEFGDESTDMVKHAKDSNRLLELMKDVSYKSLTLTFNPYDKLNNKFYFEDKFRNSGKIKDRYPIIYIDGHVIDTLRKPNRYQCEADVMQKLNEMREIASNFEYWKHNMSKHLHNWDRSLVPFKKRHLSNISPLIDTIDVYCKTQDEFNDWMTFLNKCKLEYNKKARPFTVQSDDKTFKDEFQQEFDIEEVFIE